MRQIQLESHFPPISTEIEEFKQIAKTENPEFQYLCELFGKALDNNFFLYALPEALKHYESMLHIRARPGASLEERRREIFVHWNRKLPYTLLRLKEMLKEWVGVGFYEVDTSRFTNYEIEIILKEQQQEFLRFLQKELREMIPANMFLRLSARYLQQIKTEIQYETDLTFRSDFYPRGNIKQLYLDGTWMLDGKYYLNEWAANEDDFYESRLSIQTDYIVPVRTDGSLIIEKNLWYLDGAYQLDGEKMLDAEVIFA